MAHQTADPSQWSPTECADWVASIGLPQYKAPFEKNLNGYRIQRLSTRGLTQMGIQKFDHQKQIMAALREHDILIAELDKR